MGKKLDNTAKQPEVRELEMVEMKEEIEGLKAELAGYRTMENQWMFYES
jgi:ribosomal protein L29